MGRSSQAAGLVDISCELLHETADAWLVTDDGEREIWIPKSLSEFERQKGNMGELTLPEWKAKQAGLI